MKRLAHQTDLDCPHPSPVKMGSWVRTIVVSRFVCPRILSHTNKSSLRPRSMSDRALVWSSVALAASAACRPTPQIPLLAPAAEAIAAPSVERIPLRREGEHADAHAFSFHDLLPSQQFWETNAPLETFFYAPEDGRFLVPGFAAVDELGAVTLDPDPLTGPPGTRTLPTRELSAAWLAAHPTFKDDQDGAWEAWHGHTMAVWYGEQSIVALAAQNLPVKAHAHARRLGDAILVRRFDPHTLRLHGELRLPTAGWDARTTLTRFLRDGTLIVGIHTGRHSRKEARFLGWPADLIPNTGTDSAIVRIDRNGALTVLWRDAWQCAALTGRDEVVGIAVRGRRPFLFGLNRDGVQTFRRPLGPVAFGTERIAAHREGFCVAHETGASPVWTVISCYDHEARLAWRRGVAWSATNWFVDDTGWIYLDRPVREGAEIVAVDPRGTIAWRLFHEHRPQAGLAAVKDALCFVTDPPDDPSRPAPAEFVCLRPRHGEVQQHTTAGPHEPRSRARH